VPIVWFPRLAAASPRQREGWELIGGGVGIHWGAIDEDMSVASLLQPEAFIRMQEPVRGAPVKDTAAGQRRAPQATRAATRRARR
jgi:hypothetical protein